MYNSLLTAFVCVADCGSFNKAAKQLFTSSTAVMKQINALEEHLRLKLFERSNQGTRLTQAGELIYKDARFLFEYSEQSLQRAHQIADAAATTFCVGTSMLNPCKAFMDLWFRINDAFPGYTLHIVPFEDDHNGIFAEIGALARKYDFLVGACDSSLWLERCNFLKLGEFRRCYAVPVTHRLAGRQTLSPADLHGETLLMAGRGSSPVVDRERDEMARNHPQITLADTPPFYDIGVFNHAVQTGGILSSLECWSDVHPALATIPMEGEHTVPHGIFYPLDPLPDVQQVVDTIAALVGH